MNRIIIEYLSSVDKEQLLKDYELAKRISQINADAINNWLEHLRYIAVKAKTPKESFAYEIWSYAVYKLTENRSISLRNLKRTIKQELLEDYELREMYFKDAKSADIDFSMYDM